MCVSGEGWAKQEDKNTPEIKISGVLSSAFSDFKKIQFMSYSNINIPFKSPKSLDVLKYLFI